jgi:hypothetical protein
MKPRATRCLTWESAWRMHVGELQVWAQHVAPWDDRARVRGLRLHESLVHEHVIDKPSGRTNITIQPSISHSMGFN